MTNTYRVYVQPIGGGPPEIREYDSMPPALEDFEQSCKPENSLVQLLYITPEKPAHVELVWSCSSDEEAN